MFTVDKNMEIIMFPRTIHIQNHSNASTNTKYVKAVVLKNGYIVVVDLLNNPYIIKNAVLFILQIFWIRCIFEVNIVQKMYHKWVQARLSKF